MSSPTVSPVPPPAPFGAVPSPRQLAWHRLEYYGFIHFTTNTFTGREWGLGDESPAIFNPAACDPRQWARLAREGGMRGLILTCKHHDGFCLWPSRHTAHSVKASPWKNGGGDLVRELAEACAAEGLKFGVYLSPWDRNHAQYGRPEYITYYRNQLRELLTQYGPIFEVWFDGANGGDGWYGGANEKRQIDNATYYDWPATTALVRDLQPDAVMFSDAGPDMRWVGNERGEAAETTWYTFKMAGRYPGCPVHDDLGCGHEDGTDWLPPEVDVSIRPGWFWHEQENGRVRSPANLMKLWLQSVGRGTTLLLNLPPDRRGLVHETDAANLLAFKKIRDLTFARNLAAAAVLEAANVRGGDAAAYGPARLLDGDPETYWAADDGVCQAELVVTFPTPQAVNHVLFGEAIQLGQRVRGWVLEAATAGGGWQAVAGGTTAGYKRAERFNTVTAARWRLRITDAKACPCLREFGLYHGPVPVEDPVLARDAAGRVTVSAAGLVVRVTTDGSAPTLAAPRYAAPLDLPAGGTVRAAILPEDNPEGLFVGGAAEAAACFGLAKAGWRILGCDSFGPPCPPENILTDDAAIWHTPWEGPITGHPHWIAVDLGREAVVAGFIYRPRVEAISHGTVDRWEFYVSADGVAWGAPAAAGRFDNMLANPVEQTVRLPQPVRGRCVKFVSLSAADGKPYCAMAGLEVLA
ncbi:MAG: alpha-L-fucosidase [Lentisphaeria bacterium]